MLPKIVLHKQNGHRQPAPPAPSAAQILRLVHSASPDNLPSASLVRFGAIARQERAPFMLEHAARAVDGLRDALSIALAETDEAIARGEMPDVRALLAAFRGQADAAADLLRGVIGTAARAADQLVDLNALLQPTPDVFQLSLAPGLTVRRRLDPAAPRVVADALALRDALVALVTCGTGDVTIDTSLAAGGVADEPRVRVTIRHAGPLGPNALDSAEIATRIVHAQGGVGDREPGSLGPHFVVELPVAWRRGAR